jgi:3',5'-cyclic AMP phosphodiesterase CpdA
MLIAQLSDPHFVPQGVRLFGRLDTAGYLERAIAHLNALEPDVVLITGHERRRRKRGEAPRRALSAGWPAETSAAPRVGLA